MAIQKYVVDVDSQSGQIVGNPVPYSEIPANVTNVISNDAETYIQYGIGGGVFLVFLVGVFLSFFTVKQQTVKIIERLGKFKKVAKAGLNFKIPFIDRIAGTLDLRIQQMEVNVETKTKDNVFVRLDVMVQYFIDSEKSDTAFYKLDAVQNQIKSYIFDNVRSQVPKLDLDDVFVDKEQIAISVKTDLLDTFGDFGFKILQTLVTDISPAEEVKEAMNEIQVQTRTKVANEQKGEAEKILMVKQAEAEAESKKLQGKGIADQRQAIAEGLEKSTKLLVATGVDPKEVLATLMLTQYFDTLKEIGDQDNTKVIFMPSSPAGMSNISEEIKNAMMLANETDVTPKNKMKFGGNPIIPITGKAKINE